MEIEERLLGCATNCGEWLKVPLLTSLIGSQVFTPLMGPNWLKWRLFTFRKQIAYGMRDATCCVMYADPSFPEHVYMSAGISRICIYISCIRFSFLSCAKQVGAIKDLNCLSGWQLYCTSWVVVRLISTGIVLRSATCSLIPYVINRQIAYRNWFQLLHKPFTTERWLQQLSNKLSSSQGLWTWAWLSAEMPLS